MNISHWKPVAGILALLVVAACGRVPEEPPATEPAAEKDTARKVPGLTRSPAAAAARVFFITPGDGDVRSNPVRLEFAVEGMEIAPAGTARPNTGHHHILIDTGLPALDLPIPADDKHVHFGDGSSATELTLPPGEHTLQLLFADHLHVPHDPPVHSELITITVE